MGDAILFDMNLKKVEGARASLITCGSNHSKQDNHEEIKVGWQNRRQYHSQHFQRIVYG